MPFRVVSPEKPRFDGDFRIEPAAGHDPNNAENNYIDALHALLDSFAKDAGRDESGAASSPASSLAGRKAVRLDVASQLRADADQFADGRAAPEQLLPRISELQDRYRAALEKLNQSQPGAGRFAMIDRSDRFDGCFDVTPVGSHKPSSAEAAYFAQLKGLLGDLAKDEIRNKEEKDRHAPDFLKLRQELRRNAAKDLRADLEGVNGNLLDVDVATARIKDVREKYAAELKRLDGPKFVFEERDEKRFDGDFLILPAEGYKPTDWEDRFVSRVRDVLERLAADSNRADLPASILAARAKARSETAAELRKRAEVVSKGLRAPWLASNETLILQGKYERNIELVSGSLFTVSFKSTDNFATDLVINVEKDIQPPNNVVPPEKQELYAALLAAETVIATVCTRLEEDDDSAFCTQLFGAKRKTPANERAARLRDEYVKRLAEIGRLGLEGPHTALAKVALDSLRSDFVAHEGPRIKNSYVCRLGTFAAIAAAVFLFVYTLIVTDNLARPFWVNHKSFLLVGVGAAIGTWLSFSFRQVQFSFEHLGVVEEDLLDPAFRVLIVVALAVTACLLFWTGVMNMEIGGLKTTAVVFDKNGTVALLIGLFCGLSERALATALSGRAAAFAKGVAGG